MSTYRYKAYNSAGATVSGLIEAESERQALVQLKGKGLLPREVREEGATDAVATSFSFRRGISVADLSLFTRRLATLVASAVPLYEAMGSLYEQEENPSLKQVLARVSARIAEGASLSRALAAEPKVFGESYVSMVAAGEAGGALEAVLERLADFLEEQDQVRSRVTSAMSYPILMVIVGSGVMMFLLTVVIPKIVVIFENSKAALPLITVVLIKLSHFLRGWWWIPVGLAVASVPLYRKAMLREHWRFRRDTLLLKLPLAGNMQKQLVLSRFARVLGLLLASGVPIIRALEITSEVLVNRVYRTFLREVMEEVAQGASLSGSLRKSSLFPPLLVHLTAVGEKGGTLETMLMKAGLAYEREFSARLTRLMGLMEPLLVLAMGLAVGIVVVAVLLPIFEMNQLIK
ncbi:type II secretion system inner membrane protein GspF [Geobacter sp. SVR]|uniref:type II secretion system inner membrane protein GspF n=1 Tax=Geobacter sp. SVR TaxID=2495594 RepID=UPI00143EF97A|nr:type II secretion system inner membrane protein GspF [Geobacter sp. SVR]BCS55840.1 type II secretion system protein GspF [Geobacter sp. SVR]GCF83844.1 type II secretion system protein GspF [Geobacter sp. SVR]